MGQYLAISIATNASIKKSDFTRTKLSSQMLGDLMREQNVITKMRNNTMKILTSFITKAILTVAVTLFILFNQKLIASPYTDATNLPSWFQDQEQTSIPQPGGEGPGGWAPVNPDNSPEPPAPEPEAQEPVDLKLTSSAFANGASIPVKYTCDGANVSPPLSWDAAPNGTKSIALIVNSGVTAYWVVYNIPKTVSSIPEAVPNTLVTNGFSQGINDLIPGIAGYSGPCPNATNDSKIYTFNLMALDIALDIAPGQGVKEVDVREKIYGHVIGLGTLTGTYKRTAAVITLSSSEFEQRGSIPIKFTCDGDNVSPPLNWEGVPAGARSLVLLATDSSNKALWVAYNIDPTITTNLPQAIPNVPIPNVPPNVIYQGTNDSTITGKTIGYAGPCPATAGNIQNYTFTLIALNNVPDLPAGTATLAQVSAATNGHLIGIGVLTGTYQRTVATIDLTSPKFVGGTNIPIKYTYDGDNISPPLNWSGVPANTKSLVLLVTDQLGKRKWGAFGIAPTINNLSEGIPNVAIANLNATSQIFQVKNENDPSVFGYSGPFPESVDATIKYVFTLMALNYIPDLVPGTATMDTLVAATNNHVIGLGTLTGSYNRNTAIMTLSSSAFANGGAIPAKYTCDGIDVSPPLSWSGAPDSTKSLVLLVIDNRNGKSHWVAYNIGKDRSSLPEAIPKTPSANGISQGVNNFDNTVGYSGPCPDLENDTRTYSFTIIALKETLTIAPGATYASVVGAIGDNIVGSGSMTGTYTRTVDDMGDMRGIEMNLHSTAFPMEKDGTNELRPEYTCDGLNISPTLNWSRVPATAKSIVLSMTDSSGKSHWVAFGIPAFNLSGVPTLNLREDIPKVARVAGVAGTNGFFQGMNGIDPDGEGDLTGTVGYTGPCPTVAGVSNTYTFSIMAISKVLPELIPGTSTKDDLDQAIRGYVVGSSSKVVTYKRTTAVMTLTSPGIDAGKIDVKYTYDGDNTSPQLNWTVPDSIKDNTKSFALIMTDATRKSHWIAFGILPKEDPRVGKIEAGIPNASVTNGFSQGINDFQTIGYYGPHPTAIGVSNTYTFTVMALNSVPDLAAGSATLENVMTAISGHVIGSGNLTGTYTRTVAAMTLTSSGIVNGKINVAHTCDGTNSSPPLVWNGAPASTRSFILLTTDNSNQKVQWAAFNIAATVNSLPGAVPNTAVAGISGVMVPQGFNDFNTVGYYGPCPSTTANTSYTFTVMALDTTLNLTPGLLETNSTTILTAASGHIVGSGSLPGTYQRQVVNMSLQSADLPNGADIPLQHTCDGANTSPPFTWLGVPATAQSLVLLMTDAAGKSHWVAFNIPVTPNSLPSIPKVPTTNGLYQGINAVDPDGDGPLTGSIGYSGPCPETAGVTNTYTFTLMALNTTLNLAPGTSDMAAVQTAVNGHLVGSATLTSAYTRNTTIMTVQSLSFPANGPIPIKYTCDGEGVSPQLSWNGAPAGTKSFILHAADSSSKTYWIAFNIGKDINSLPEAIPNTAVANGVSQGGNDLDVIGYSGLCPDVANVAKSYTFTIMALDTTLNLPPGFLTTDSLAVMAAASGHIIGSGSLTGTYTRTTTVMTLESTAFTNGNAIPIKYTCDGTNVSPPLNWHDVPASTRSFLLLTSDANRKVHWVAFNIGSGINNLPEAVPNTAVANGVSQGGNDFSVIGYSGPCPDVANVTKSYTFTVMALDTILDLTPGFLSVGYENIMVQVNGHIVGSGSLTGTYIRTTTVMDVKSIKNGVNVFTNRTPIPVKYTCDGDNVSPPLSWSGAPPNAKSFVVVMRESSYEGTSTTIDKNIHWVVFNVTSSMDSLPEDVPNGRFVNGVNQATNGFDIAGYSGPCPKLANVTTTYSFTVIALDIPNASIPSLSIQSNYDEIMLQIEGHVVGSGTLTGTYTRTTAVMNLQSTAFTNGAAIPIKYTCDGANVSPPLSWEGVPEEAKSLVLLVTDNTRKSLWVAYSIDPTITTNLPSAIPNELITKGLSQGLNDFNTIGYAGPCPTNVGNYTFTLMALNTVPSLAAGTATIADVYAATDGHLVGIGMLTGTYKRTNAVINLQSSAFVNGTNIPMKYTCDGDNISPPLNWAGVPENTKSLVLLVTDQVGNRKWGAFSIAPSINKLSEAVPNVAIANLDATSQIFQVKNDNNPSVIGYSGPCPESVPPASADETVKYVFTLMALNYIPDVAPGSTMDTLVAATNNHVVGVGTLTGGYNRNTAVMTLSSSAFSNSGAMPAKYTCDGIDVSPPLNWSGAPESTKSLVLLVTDNRNGKSHWVAYNIGRDRNSLPEAIPKSISADGIEQNKNSFDDTYGYSGPCPDLENYTRIYSFTIIALNIKLTLDQLGGDCIVLCDSIIDNIVGSGSMTGTYTRTTTVMTLESTAFTNGNPIPVKYTCDGANVSPPLNWSNAPISAKSFIVLTTDASRKSHWVAFNIGQGINSLPEAVPNTGVANGVSQGGNDFSVIGYSGPCPDVANVTKSYTFTVMALDITLNLTPGYLTTDSTAVMAAASGHIVGSGSLTGTYTRTTAVMNLQSTAFTNGAAIPIKYTCDGDNVSPPLNWSDAPANTKSFILIATESTHPDLAVQRVHWVAFNMAPTVTALPGAVPNTPVAGVGNVIVPQGTNDFPIDGSDDVFTVGYSGPCPDVANVTKSYTFTVMALDVPPLATLIPGVSSAADVFEAVHPYIVGSGSLTGTYRRGVAAMTLTSTSFSDGNPILPNHTCVGDGTGRVTSPPLAWTNVPSNAQSLVLLVIDANPVNSAKIAQWVAFNISPTFTGLSAGIPNVSTYNGFSQGKNDFDGGIGYAEPCPPVGDPTHTYVFTLMALDITLAQDPLSATYTNIFTATAGHVVGTANLTGTVERTISGNNFSLSSSAIVSPDYEIPLLYTCDGSSLSPPLQWDHTPAGTKSLVLTMTGTGTPDATGIFDPAACHWAAINIPATQTGLTAGQANTFFTGSFYQSKNYLDWYGYAAPCPEGGTTGNYLFTLTALNQQLSGLDTTSTCDDVIDAIFQQNILATATMPGKYTRDNAQGDRLSLSTSVAFNYDNPTTDAIETDIPPKYTCDGANISLPLTWNNIPANTQSLAIVMTDGDADTGANEPVAHWIAYDISVTQSSVPENMPRLPLVYNTYQGTNDFERVGYDGPCPTAGDDTHRYLFEIFALNARLNTTSALMTYDKFLELTTNKIIESASFQGTYTREPAQGEFTLTSTAFDFGEPILSRYTCDGLSISPPLTWQNWPINDDDTRTTNSFAILMTDLNAPVGSNAHWVLYNIPVPDAGTTTMTLAEGVPIGATPSIITTPAIASGSAQAFNDIGVGVQGYSGPCPPAGSGAHQYEFKLVALNQAILTRNDGGDLPANPTYADITLAMEGNIVGSVKLNGTYEKQTDGAFKLTSPAFADGVVLDRKYRSSYAYQTWEVVQISVEPAQYIIVTKDRKYCGNASITDDLQGIYNPNVVNDENIFAQNIAPPLQWANVPAGTKSLMLLIKTEDNADVTSSPWEGNTHWVLYDIPPTLTGLDEGFPQVPATGNAYNGINDAPWNVGLTSPQLRPQPNLAPSAIYTDAAIPHAIIADHYQIGHYNGYWGPCRPGRYVFSLMALDSMLGLNPLQTDYADLIQDMLGKWIDTAELLTVRIAGPILTLPEDMIVAAAANHETVGTDVPFIVTGTDENGTALTSVESPSTTLTDLGYMCSTVTTPPVSLYPGSDGNTFEVNFAELGTTEITCEALASGETATEFFTITVADQTRPVFGTPTATEAPDSDNNFAEVVNFDITATDNVDADSSLLDTSSEITILCNPPSGSIFALGITSVICTATDTSGNRSSTTFNVTVSQ